ncbi:MAG: hypothetical protein ACREHD_15110, partial [Pirellulales bacterium]
LDERRSRQRVDKQKLLRACHAIAAIADAIRFQWLEERLSVPRGRLRALLRQAESERLFERGENDTWRLTDLGRQRAAAISRAQRLWALFLTEYPDSVSLFADLDVERIDEVLPNEVVNDLEEKLRQ